VDLVRDGGDQGFEKVRCRLAVGCIVKSGKGELGRAIHGHEQMQLAFLGVHLGDVEMEIADRVGLEWFLRGFVALDLRQPAYVVALKEAMKGRPGEMRYRRLQRIKAIIERQQRKFAEGDGDRFLFGRQYRRAGSFGAHRRVLHEVALLPLRNRLGIEAVAFG